ncbi:MAG: hypothetical protein KGN38_06295 [Actinomycetales bacterium]|nr:hypothetical protein [Actinomycetales bacterium]
MSGWWWLAVAGALVALLALYLSMTAGRLDRLHRRIDAAETALDVQLLKRSALVLDLASTALFDPATTVVLADSAHGARAAQDDDRVARGLAESNLTRVLAEALSDREEVDELREDPEYAQMLEELRASCVRVQLSRRFLNDGVRACRQVRKQRFVRWFSLAGRTPWPDTVEMDDTPPPGLALH